jgi:hypothetical protein
MENIHPKLSSLDLQSVIIPGNTIVKEINRVSDERHLKIFK